MSSNGLLAYLSLQNFATLVLIAFGIWVLYVGRFIRYIPNNRVGIVEKLFSLRGSVKQGIIALNNEAGYQPQVLRGGWHVMTPFIYRIHKVPLVTIPQGSVGYVFARDGFALAPEQALASNVHANSFEDVYHFLANGGQKGPQRKILREGTYAINLAQFVVISRDFLYFHDLDPGDQSLFAQTAELIAERQGFEPVIIKDQADSLGIVTIHDGPSLAQGEIIAPVVGSDPKSTSFHNNFQDPEAFLLAGGRRGRQLQVLVEGTYYINRLFATVEIIPKTVVEVGQVGVVVSYTGVTGPDLSGSEYKHGELVKQGAKGVWETALLPGKYAFNTYAGKAIMVPTTNFILKWKRNESGAHLFDENLAEVSLITRDAFEPSLPLSVVVHIDYRKAPLVIQRFGDIKRLVEQTLDPMVSAYFKNVAQTRTLIELLQDRSKIQQVAAEEMREKFEHYNLELEEVLIGTPTSGAGGGQIEQILTQLRARQIAEEQVETYVRQQKAAAKERELREAEARAKQQQYLTESEISIAIQSNQGKAEYQRALQQASQIRALAEAEAEKAARVGIAQAMAVEEQVNAYGGPQFQVMQQVMNRFAEAIQQSKVDIVPKVVISGGGAANGADAGGGNNLLQALMALILSEKAGVDFQRTESDPALQEVRAELRAKIAQSVKSSPGASKPIEAA